ncbi:MAG TPA: hypothetical protein VGL79_03880 [Solirubrobacteraceae bacterium]
MTRPTVALVVGLVLTGFVLALTLSGSPLVVTAVNATPANQPILRAGSDTAVCQSGEALPAGISALRFTMVAVVGPRVAVTVSSGSHVLTSGVAGSGWTSGAVTVPVKPLAHAVSGARLCFKLGRSAESVELGGSATSAALAATRAGGVPLAGRFTVEYMRPGQDSWWSLTKTVARQMGLGRAPAGSWVALFLILAMGTVLALSSWLLVRELG